MMSQKKVETDAGSETPGLRPVGLTLSSIFFAISGGFYLVYPLLVEDPTIIPLYVIGVLSFAGSYGVGRMTRWGLWLGLLLFPIQVVAPAFALQVGLQLLGLSQTYATVALVTSLVVLLFLAVLSFLLVLDKRKSFM